jgi:acyl dehydratase
VVPDRDRSAEPVETRGDGGSILATPRFIRRPDDPPSMATNPPAEGETHTHERTFTREDVRRFGELSGDRQPIHTERDEEGRLIVQGLLTATIPTKIGGDLEFLARTMEYDFRRPVHTGETITCEWTTESVVEREDRYEATGTAVCRNDEDVVVMSGSFEGIVRKEV